MIVIIEKEGKEVELANQLADQIVLLLKNEKVIKIIDESINEIIFPYELRRN